MARIGNDPDGEDPLCLNGRDADIPHVIDDNDRPIREYVVPILDHLNPGIVRNGITSFWQSEDEMLYEAWEKFKELLKKCLMQSFQHWTQMEMFYNGLNTYTRMVVDTSANGTLLGKSYNEACEILERIANNDYQYPTTRVRIGRRATRAKEFDAITSLTAQIHP
ncbi:Retrotransposon gag protein [Gossypium australe]|uniref:Retrotransposon gag protein n=1 Tax=Gossypium australe TaxID=47621 RepID=A0A5B6VKZ7_9ROSI|nr:Retrotransposon gag protein [Gossypium australe]